MKARAAIVMALATLAMASVALAVPPTRITIVSVFDPITFGDNAYVNGQLIGAPAGQAVALEQSAAPFTDWTPVGQTTTDRNGYYSFKLHPGQTFHYRTSSEGVLSERIVVISVAPRLRLAATRAGGSSIRFSGTIAPGLPGERVLVQRRGSGGWRTVGSARLQRGTSFAGRVRARRTLTLRAFYSNEPTHRAASSQPVTVRF